MSETNNERYVILDRKFTVDELLNYPNDPRVEPVLYREFDNALTAAKPLANETLTER